VVVEDEHVVRVEPLGHRPDRVFDCLAHVRVAGQVIEVRPAVGEQAVLRVIERRPATVLEQVAGGPLVCGVSEHVRREAEGDDERPDPVARHLRERVGVTPLLFEVVEHLFDPLVVAVVPE